MRRTSAGRRQPHLSRIAREHLLSHLPLQDLDPLRQGGLSQVERGRGPSEMAVVNDGDKRPKVP